MTFDPLTLEIMRLMFTYPMSTVRVLHMLIHLSSSHVTLLPRKFQPF